MIQMYVMYIKIMLHRKRFYLWNLLFPIAIAFLLSVVTKNLTQLDGFTAIPVGIVQQGDTVNAELLLEIMSQSVTSNGKTMFHVSEYSLEEAEELLNQQQLDAYVVAGASYQMYQNQNGLNQSIVEFYLNQFEQVQKHCKEAGISQEMTQKYLLSIQEDYKYEENVTNGQTSKNGMMYFYTLIGMCCFLALNFGIYLSESILPNQSKLAARMNCTPAGKARRLASGILAALTVSLFCVILVLCFLRYLLGYPFAFENNLVWQLILAGLLFGILFGYLLGSLFQMHRAWKETIAMTCTLVFCFFSGLVRLDVRYYISQKAEWLGYCNPVSLVSDGLYSLFYLEDVRQYMIELWVLSAMVLVLAAGVIVQTGRRAYDRI